MFQLNKFPFRKFLGKSEFIIFWIRKRYSLGTDFRNLETRLYYVSIVTTIPLSLMYTSFLVLIVLNLRNPYHFNSSAVQNDARFSTKVLQMPQIFFDDVFCCPVRYIFFAKIRQEFILIQEPKRVFASFIFP